MYAYLNFVTLRVANFAIIQFLNKHEEKSMKVYILYDQRQYHAQQYQRDVIYTSRILFNYHYHKAQH